MTDPLPCTVERTAWFFVGLGMFSLSDPTVCGDLSTAYFLGDDINASLLQDDHYRKLRHKRVSKVERFAKSRHFSPCSMKADVDAIPMWRFAMEVKENPNAIGERRTKNAQKPLTLATSKVPIANDPNTSPYQKA